MFVVVVILFSSSSAQVFGAGGFFGTQDRIKCLQPIEEENPAGTKPLITIRDLNHPKYSLCYKTSIFFFFAGIYLHDDGYVLAERDDAFEYVPLNEAKIAEYQEKGLLPTPLPPYSIPWSQYVIGYSLWLLIAVLIIGQILWRWFKVWKNKGRYCLNCDLILTNHDFTTGKCGSCGEPVPDASRPINSQT